MATKEKLARSNKKWTVEEEEFLENYYRYYDNNFLAEILGRTEIAITWKHTNLKIFRKFRVGYNDRKIV